MPPIVPPWPRGSRHRIADTKVGAPSRDGQCTVSRVDERGLERKARLVEILLVAARRLGQALAPADVYGTFHELLADVVPHDGIVVSSYDAADDLIRCEYAWVEGELADAASLPALPLNREGGGMQSRVIVSGEPLLVNDVGEQVKDRRGVFYDVDREGTVRKVPDSGPPGTQAAMMVPVREEGRVVGVVQLMTDTGSYDREQLELFEALVEQLATAVRNARLQSRQRQLEAAEAAARAVAAEREHAAQVLDLVGEGIFLVDEQGVVRSWNRAAELATRVSAAAAVGRPASELFRGWPSLAERIPTAAAGSAPLAATLPVVFAHGELWLSFVAVRGDGGAAYAFRDVTSERRLEEEKVDFVSIISHELRTPMAGIYGAAETLLRRRQELTEAQQHELLEIVVKQAVRLRQLTEEVLLAGRLNRGELDLTLEPVDLAELVARAVEASQSQADPPQIRIEAGDGPYLVAGDRDRIDQILLNLLDNAAKYGESPIAIRLNRNHSAVFVAVSDAGAGIATADQERIFEKFYRAGPSLTRPSAGSGLGLYIARELATRMGGSLSVHSEPGRGTTFTLELPPAYTVDDPQARHEYESS
jgi:signal transduction histidine kinase